MGKSSASIYTLRPLFYPGAWKRVDNTQIHCLGHSPFLISVFKKKNIKVKNFKEYPKAYKAVSDSKRSLSAVISKVLDRAFLGSSSFI